MGPLLFDGGVHDEGAGLGADQLTHHGLVENASFAIEDHLPAPLSRSAPLIFGFGFDDGEREVAPHAQEIIGALLLAARGAVAGHYDAAIGEGNLLKDLLVGPVRPVEGRKDVGAAGVGFVHGFSSADGLPLNPARGGWLPSHLYYFG